LLTEFLGNLHPVIVHLPIGFLFIACLFQWLSLKPRYASLQVATNLSLLAGLIAAILACTTGLILSSSGDYDEELLNKHKWFGIALAIISIAYYFAYRSSRNKKVPFAFSIIVFLLILITGHLGGSITHGADFLTKAFRESADSATRRKPIPDVQEAAVYNDVIQPLFQTKCYHCHGKTRQKGELRLDQPDRILKGGKDGDVILIHDPENSEMLRRLLLAKEEDDHMPPKERPQLKEDEVALIHWWISSGAPFDKKVKDLRQPERIKTILLALQSTGEDRLALPDIPAKPVEPAAESDIQKAKSVGIIILPIAQNNNYLMANFITAAGNGDSLVKILSPLKKQLVWLKMGSSTISDSALRILSSFHNLRRLQIDHTQVTDTGLAYLKDLTELRYLNLVGTRITAKGVKELKDLKNLQSLYLYQTEVDSLSRQELKQLFPKATIDYGGYNVPTLTTDTTIVKPPKKD